MKTSSLAILRVAFLLVLGLTARAAVPSYRAVASEGKVAFSISHLTNTATGRFKKFEGTLTFSKANPETSSIEFSVDTASIDTGCRRRRR